MRYLNEEVKPFFVLLEKCFVYGIQGGNNLSDEGPCVVGLTTTKGSLITLKTKERIYAL